MVPLDSNRRNLEPRGPGQVGYMSSSIETALDILGELCGIYEWKAKGTRPDQPNNVVLYVGSTVSIKHGLRTTDYGLRTGYKTRTEV